MPSHKLEQFLTTLEISNETGSSPESVDKVSATLACNLPANHTMLDFRIPIHLFGLFRNTQIYGWKFGKIILDLTKTEIWSNYVFLTETCKFDHKELESLAVIVLHDPVALRKCWEEVCQANQNLRGDSRKLLHLLQYNLEKSVNFSHSVVPKCLRDGAQ